jgi:hypothetical protein
MQATTLQNVAALLVRMVGILLILYGFSNLCRSPALVQRSVGEDVHVGVRDVTLWSGERALVLPAKAVRILIIMFYLGEAAVGGLAIYASRPLGRLLCSGLS